MPHRKGPVYSNLELLLTSADPTYKPKRTQAVSSRTVLLFFAVIPLS